MKRLIFICAITVLSIWFFSACESESSADVNQDRIYVLYEQVYNETLDISYARATFFFGGVTGTRLELASPSEVKANTELMGYMPTLAYYEKQNTGFVQSCEFEWKDTDGNIFVNTATIKTVGLPATMDTIVKGQSYELFWVGDSLTNNESVWVYINGTAEEDEVLATQNTQNATSILLTAVQTEKLTVGTNEINITRRSNTDAQEVTSAGGACAGVFESAKVEIQVKE